MSKKRNAFSDITRACELMRATARTAAQDVAGCASENPQVKKSFERLREAADALQPLPNAFVQRALTLIERARWHIISARKCMQPDGIHHRERFLDAYQQLMRTNQELQAVVTKIQANWPEAAAEAEDIRESIQKMESFAHQILGLEPDILFIRTGSDGPGPKNSLS